MLITVLGFELFLGAGGVGREVVKQLRARGLKINIVVWDQVEIFENPRRKFFTSLYSQLDLQKLIGSRGTQLRVYIIIKSIYRVRKQ